MARPKTKTTVSKTAYQCETCGTVFTGKKCPECAETTAILELSADGIPVTDIQSVIGPQPRPSIVLGDNDLLDPEEEMRRLAAIEHKQIITDTMLDKAKARRADEEAKMIRSQQELELTKKGFMDTKSIVSGDSANGTPSMPQSTMNVAPGMIIKELGNWSPEDRDAFLDDLESNPQRAAALSMLGNPQMQQMQNPMMGQMMNPMMMGGMQQQPAPAPQPSMAETMSAMLGIMQKMQEMSNANQPKDNGLDRVMDKLERIEKRNSELELKIVEMGSMANPMDMEAVRGMVRDAQEQARSGQDDMLGSFQQITGFINQMEELGLVRSRSGADAATLEEKQWNAEFKLREKTMDREYEDKKTAAQIEREKQNASSAMLQSFMNIATAQSDEIAREEEKPEVQQTRVASVMS